MLQAISDILPSKVSPDLAVRKIYTLKAIFIKNENAKVKVWYKTDFFSLDKDIKLPFWFSKRLRDIWSAISWYENIASTTDMAVICKYNCSFGIYSKTNSSTKLPPWLMHHTQMRNIMKFLFLWAAFYSGISFSKTLILTRITFIVAIVMKPQDTINDPMRH